MPSRSRRSGAKKAAASKDAASVKPHLCVKLCLAGTPKIGDRTISVNAASWTDEKGAFRCNSCFDHTSPAVTEKWRLVNACACGRATVSEEDTKEKKWYCSLCWDEHRGAQVTAVKARTPTAGRRLPKNKDCECGRGEVIDLDPETKKWYCQKCWAEYDGQGASAAKSEKKPRNRRRNKKAKEGEEGATKEGEEKKEAPKKEESKKEKKEAPKKEDAPKKEKKEKEAPKKEESKKDEAAKKEVV